MVHMKKNIKKTDSFTWEDMGFRAIYIYHNPWQSCQA